jgi:hypothetical protein
MQKMSIFYKLTRCHTTVESHFNKTQIIRFHCTTDVKNNELCYCFTSVLMITKPVEAVGKTLDEQDVRKAVATG